MSMKKYNLISVVFLLFGLVNLQTQAQQKQLSNQKADGFKGIWYMIQPTGNEYAYKYSGGLGTYPANHRPFAVYAKEVKKTFFCFGGTDDSNGTLLHNVSYYDHRTGKVANPTIVLDKKTIDAHDNPVMSIDKDGFIWIFSTSHGIERPSYISRSRKPYDISSFELVQATERLNGKDVPFTNFSYFQVYYREDKGFFALFSKYDHKHRRVIGYNTSKDGQHWDEWKVLGNIEGGHYQISTMSAGKIGVAFDFHPAGKGLDYRTNLYFMETADWGETWRTASQQRVELPLTNRDNPALVKDFVSSSLNNYLLDISFDRKGKPMILTLTSKGPQPGPQNGPRDWHFFYLNSGLWKHSKITSSDSNYDMGSIYPEGRSRVKIIAPTETGPQAYNPGGEIAIWASGNGGRSWIKKSQITNKSTMNHSYVRKPSLAHKDFYGFWADGDARKPSNSSLYFTNKKGEVFQLPRHATLDLISPQKLK